MATTVSWRSHKRRKASLLSLPSYWGSQTCAAALDNDHRIAVGSFSEQAFDVGRVGRFGLERRDSVLDALVVDARRWRLRRLRLARRSVTGVLDDLTFECTHQSVTGPW